MATLTVSSPSAIRFARFRPGQRGFKKQLPERIRRDQYHLQFRVWKDYRRFMSGLHILEAIGTSKPRSLYSLAQIEEMDPANLRKLLIFYRDLEVLVLKPERGSRGAIVPVLTFSEVVFILAPTN